MTLDAVLDTMPPTFQQWLEHHLDHDQLCDLAHYGAAAGVPGLIYYTETTRLYQRYHDEIWDALAEHTDAFGYPTIPSLIASFPIAQHVTDAATLRNALVWYPAEHSALCLTYT